MSELVLWGRASSVNVQKVLWFLAETGAPFEHHVVGGPYGGLDRPEFASLSPMPRVPVLQHGELAIWESHAVLRYLAEFVAPHALSPKTATARAGIEPWMELVSTTLQPPFIALFWQKVRMTEDLRDGAKIEAARKAMQPALAAIAGKLETTEWLAGDEMSLADIAAGSLMFRINDVAPDLLQDGALQRWYAQLASREAYRASVMTNYDELRAS